ncbi:tripartite tricarboxylate transporter substrate binding protein [Nitratireductor sp. ZSWI3]|uniref:Bug family tripartite tricarboxylate transporter substrate binding protein n=1 Tax=Nitratireductor sp. ZSWI3 TaxID=2966359 RepID=UPI0021504F3E|nr:tripartite tricarboxylate transporter substrate binding protein [Nitratireductor sp. ZSWI3]MCR4265393.1 tripartite tricarboxylate transporter substrate binding protein [Nitratireductor sp. ZSWI3]
MKRLLKTMGLAITAVAALQSAPLHAEEFPARGLEFVAGYGPGGGHDTMLRAMAKILKEEGIVEVPINVVNKPGGSSAVAMGYLNARAGDGHYLMSITSSHITTPLASNIGLDHTNFTPIARLGIDPELLVVNAAGPYKSIKDLLKADKVLNVGGTATGSIEHIVSIQFQKKTGKEINFVPFQGDGDVVAALLSNQLDFIVTNPGTARDFIEAGNFKALAISTDERIDALPDVPTFKEQDIDITLSLYRGVTAPADISEEAKAYLTEKMTELSESEAWKTGYMEPNAVVGDFITGEEFEAYLAENEKLYRETLTELGILK